VCDKCTDDRKGKPVLGLTILRHLKTERRRQVRVGRRQVLDPNNGKTYYLRPD
jgi:uncharacterized protein (DUF2147 family)